MTARRQNFTTKDPCGRGTIGGIHSIPDDTRDHIVNQECWCQPIEANGRWHHWEERRAKKPGRPKWAK